MSDQNENQNLEVLHFFVSWSGANLMQMPEIDRLSSEIPWLTIKNIDAETDKEMVEKYGIEESPAIVILKDGQLMSRLVGVYTCEDIKEEIKTLTNN